MALISLDFHNTLFQCDDWFRLEVETLPAAFFAWRTEGSTSLVSDQLTSEALAAYREIRKTVTTTGRESDAVSSLSTVCDRLQVSVSGDEVERGVCQVMERALDTAAPIEGAASLVQRLKGQGHTLAVVSSAAYHPFLEWALARHGMLESFTEVITSASCGIYKSNPDIYRYTIERLGVESADSIHIGDSHRFDVATAAKAGMRTILLADSSDTTLQPRPDACIASLGEAPEVLDRLLTRREPDLIGE